MNRSFKLPAAALLSCFATILPPTSAHAVTLYVSGTVTGFSDPIGAFASRSLMGKAITGEFWLSDDPVCYAPLPPMGGCVAVGPMRVDGFLITPDTFSSGGTALDGSIGVYMFPTAPTRVVGFGMDAPYYGGASYTVSAAGVASWGFGGAAVPYSNGPWVGLNATGVVTSPIPEPGTLAMACGGLAGLLAQIRRRRASPSS